MIIRMARKAVRYLRYVSSGGVAHARSLGVRVGTGTSIHTRHLGSEPWLIKIGSNVTISVDSMLITHDATGRLYVDEKGRRYKYAPIDIADDVFVGAAAIIMPGVRVGKGSVIAAGSVVTKSVPEGSVVAGNPARYLCSFVELMDKVKTWPSESDLPADRSVTTKERSLLLLEDWKPYLNRY